MPAPSTVTIPGYARGETREIPGSSLELGPLPRLPTLPLKEALDSDNDDEIAAHDNCNQRCAAQKKLDEKAEAERLVAVAGRKERLPFDKTIAAELCEQIAEGGALKAVCAEREDFPSARRARKWLRDNEAFAVQYAKACEERLSAWEDDILLIADDTSRDRVEKARGKGLETDSGAVARSKLQVEARKALLRANNPTKWGEAIQVVNPEQQDPFAGISLERIEEAARAAELEEIVEQKRALDRENEQRRAKGEALLDFAAFLARDRRGREARGEGDSKGCQEGPEPAPTTREASEPAKTVHGLLRP
jgi:hypothetical protein